MEISHENFNILREEAYRVFKAATSSGDDLSSGLLIRRCEKVIFRRIMSERSFGIDRLAGHGFV